jgi:nucleoid DNA-binding protein
MTDKPLKSRVTMAEAVANRTDIDRDDVLEVVDAWLDELASTLADGQRVVIRGFGTFQTVLHNARVVQNPVQGAIEVPPKRRIRFTPSDVLKARIEAP